MIKKFTELDYETLALFSYIFAVSFSILGPVFHYIGWAVSLFSLLYGIIRYKDNLLCKVDKFSKSIWMILSLFLLWSLLANLLTAGSFYYWGKSASVQLELFIGVILAVRLLNKERNRKIFTLSFVAINSIIATAIIIVRIFNLTSPLGGLTGNILGLYSVVIMPAFFCSAIWLCKNSFYRFLLLVISSIITILSFSSGPFLTVILQTIIIVFYARRQQHINLKILSTYLLILVMFLVSLSFISGNKVLPRLKQEFTQIFAVHDVEALTSKRNRCWAATFFMIKQRPLLGHGSALFHKHYRDNLQAFIDNDIIKVDEVIYAHPHSMYLGTLFDTGILGLILLLLAFVFSIKKALILLHRSPYRKEFIPWTVLGFSLLLGQLLYGFVGDIFESRNDIAPILWAFWGILLSLNTNFESNDSKLEENSSIT